MKIKLEENPYHKGMWTDYWTFCCDELESTRGYERNYSNTNLYYRFDENNKPEIFLNVGHDCRDFNSMVIHYCPFCGKKIEFELKIIKVKVEPPND